MLTRGRSVVCRSTTFDPSARQTPAGKHEFIPSATGGSTGPQPPSRKSPARPPPAPDGCLRRNRSGAANAVVPANNTIAWPLPAPDAVNTPGPYAPHPEPPRIAALAPRLHDHLRQGQGRPLPETPRPTPRATAPRCAAALPQTAAPPDRRTARALPPGSSAAENQRPQAVRPRGSSPPAPPPAIPASTGRRRPEQPRLAVSAHPRRVEHAPALGHVRPRRRRHLQHDAHPRRAPPRERIYT